MALDQETFDSYMETYLAENDINIAGDLNVTGTMTVTGTVTAGTLNNAEMTQLRNNNASLTTQNQSLTSANETLTSEKQALTTANETLTSENQTLTSEKQALTTANETLTSENQTLTSANQSLTSANETLTADKATLEARVAELEAGSSGAPEGVWAEYIIGGGGNLIVNALHNLKAVITASRTTLYNFFSGNTAKTIDLSGVDTSNATNMQQCFYNCPNLTSLDLSSFNTSNVTNMQQCFYSCSGLTSLDLSNFNTSNVTVFCGNSTYDVQQGLFASCRGLTQILGISSLVTSKISNLNCMFYGCSELTSIDISNWDTSAVTLFRCAFQNCSKLTSLGDVTFDLTSATNISNMFSGCTALGTNGVTLKFKNVPSAKWADEAALRTAASIPSGCVVQIDNFI